MYSADKLVHKKPGSSHSGNLRAKKTPLGVFVLRKERERERKVQEFKLKYLYKNIRIIFLTGGLMYLLYI